MQYWGGSYDIDFSYNSKNKWVHFAHVYDGTRTRIYANTQLVVDEPRALNTTDRKTFKIGRWDNHHFDGIIDDVRIYNYPLDIDAILAITRGGCAENPHPFDSEIDTPYCATLSWMPGAKAYYQDVYFGTNQDAVANATTASPQYKGRQTDTFYVPTINKNTQYFWRVDEVKQDNSIQTGNLWSFTLTGGLVSHWKLDESQGKIAHDSAGDKNGLLSGKNLWSSDGKIDGALKFDGDKNDVAISDLNLNTNTITITAWVHQMNSANNLSAIVFWRHGDGPVGGLNFYFNHELRYHWTHKTWTWSSGLTVPHDRWAFIAMVIEPQKATLYVHDGNEMKSATNNLIHPPQSFDGTTYLARDINWPKRSFKGMLDDIRIYNYSLTKTQIESICNNKDIK